MEDTVQLKQLVIKKLDVLSNEKLIEVLDFVNFLLTQSKQTVISPEETPRPHGSLEDLFACVGIWAFEPGELDEILEAIEESRLMELAEYDDRLLT